MLTAHLVPSINRDRRPTLSTSSAVSSDCDLAALQNFTFDPFLAFLQSYEHAFAHFWPISSCPPYCWVPNTSLDTRIPTLSLGRSVVFSRNLKKNRQTNRKCKINLLINNVYVILSACVDWPLNLLKVYSAQRKNYECMTFFAPRIIRSYPSPIPLS